MTALSTREALAKALCAVRDEDEHAPHVTPVGQSCRYCDSLADRLLASGAVLDADALADTLLTPSGPDWQLGAYYFSFDRTGVALVDAILSEVAIAGSAYHHTEMWNDDGHTDRIQKAANAAATTIRTALTERAS